jgi:hypothetical protein
MLAAPGAGLRSSDTGVAGVGAGRVPEGILSCHRRRGPTKATAATGMDALTHATPRHAIESYSSIRPNQAF